MRRAQVPPPRRFRRCNRSAPFGSDSSLFFVRYPAQNPVRRGRWQRNGQPRDNRRRIRKIVSRSQGKTDVNVGGCNSAQRFQGRQRELLDYSIRPEAEAGTAKRGSFLRSYPVRSINSLLLEALRRSYFWATTGRGTPADAFCEISAKPRCRALFSTAWSRV